MLSRRLIQKAVTPRNSRGLASNLLSRPKEQWTLNELKSEAKKRGLFQSGGKASLLARLQADDASNTPAERTATAHATPAQFSSTRTIHSSSSRDASAVEDSKFAPRRSAPLDIKMPVLDIDEPEISPIIPYVPDNYDSTPALSASPPPPEPSTAPKVVTVASAITHIDGGPSHPSADIADPIEAPKEPSYWSNLSSQFSNTINDLLGSSSSSGSGPQAEAEEPPVDTKSELNSDEKRGLVVLASIFVGGWVLGGFSTKKADDHHEEPVKH